MNTPYLTQDGRCLTLAVRVCPNAHRAGVEGLWNGSHLKIALTAPPVDGKANEVLITCLADLLSVRKSAITLVSGQTGRVKRLVIQFSDSSAATAAAQHLTDLI